MLTNDIALVTGASRGIGRAIAVTLGQAGALVIGTATTQAGAEAISERLAAAGRGEGRVLNVTDAVAVEACVKDIEARFGAPTILVNNAGITRDTLLMRMKDDDWSAVLETNLTAVFRLCRACIRPMMKARYGRIVNISSVVGATGNPGQTNYTAAKAGLSGFTKSLAREVGSRGITVNCVAPGAIDTDMTNALPEDYRKGLLASIPLGRMGQPEDIAQAVLFLVSGGGAYITGETLHINGGMYMA